MEKLITGLVEAFLGYAAVYLIFWGIGRVLNGPEPKKDQKHKSKYWG